MWDVGIHILGIMAECACREAGGSGTRPYGGLRDRPVLRRGRTPAGRKRAKRDWSGTSPLKPRGETQFRIKFLCLLSFSKKVRGPGGEPEPSTCVCCKGEGEMGDINFFWVRSYHN